MKTILNAVKQFISKIEMIKDAITKRYKLSSAKQKWIVVLFCFLSWCTYSKLTFRFENFDDGKKTAIYLKKRFPKGSKAGPLLKTLKSAGADCVKVIEPNDPKSIPRETKEYWFCDYGHWQFSWHLIIRHYVGVYIDSEGKVIDLYAGRELETL
jgi:hypothetical protein